MQPHHAHLLAQRHPSTSQVARHLLVDDGDPVTTAFSNFAEYLITVVPQETPEFTVGLRKLLEARDAVLRCRTEPPEAMTASAPRRRRGHVFPDDVGGGQ